MSGRLFGAHQKIDRLARATLQLLLPQDTTFPSSKLILHFEGINGPDAIKRKSPAQDEPWHYFEPFNTDDKQLLRLIDGHYSALIMALKNHDSVRSAFEAAWLAHALVDGLTPAHHYPYEEKLSELRGGLSNKSRTSIKTKLVMPGDTRREQVRNNWRMWGPRGLLTMHGMFEWGIAGIIVPMRAKMFAPTADEIAQAGQTSVSDLFRHEAQEIARLKLYEQYSEHGWTPRLARVVRQELLPSIIRTVTLVWYAASLEANEDGA